MQDLLELTAALVAVHVALGLHWFRRPVYAFRALFGAAPAAIAGSTPWGSDRMGLIFGPPVPGLGSVHLVELLPLALARNAVGSWVAHAANPGGATPQLSRVLRWEELVGVRAEGRNVLANGGVLAETSSSAHARHLARLLVRLRALDERARVREIEAELARSLDADAARARLDVYRAVARRLAWPAVATAVLLFLAVPLAGWQFGLGLSWPWLAGALVLLQAWSGLAFSRAHRKLRPTERRERVGQTILLALSPLEALRSAEHLGRDLFAGFHPLAAGAALLGRARFEQLAGAILRDALHPLPSAPQDATADLVAVERESRERLIVALRALARRLELPADLGARAPAADADEHGYCPRCLRTFVIASGACAECWDLPLAPLPARIPSEAVTPSLARAS